MRPLFIPEERVESLLSLEELFPAIKKALIDLSAGRVIQPVRTIVAVPEHAGFWGLMPAVYGDVMGAKLVSFFPRNADRGLHTHLATILLFRADTGELLAIMDGRVITAWRTAVVSAIATEELAPVDARVLAVLGSGVQARTHFRAFTKVRSFAEVRVWSPHREHAIQFAAEIGAEFRAVEDAVRGADVIVTVTSASTPILRGAWLKEGVYVNAVGAVGMDRRELDDEVLRNALVVVESREAALRESGEIMQSGAQISAEIGEVLGGAMLSPRGGRIVFKSLGIAIEDLVAARLVYERAMRESTGPGGAA